MRFLRLAAALFVVLPAAVQAQWPPKRLENLKVLPKDISVTSLVDTMAGFTRALGVRCVFCHVGNDAASLDTYDFVSDSLVSKGKAREMMRMVLAINGEHLTKLTARRDPAIVVTCATCHRGIMQPRSLQQVLTMAYDGGGVDSLEKSYRSLRDQYYGRSAYDFGEVPLADVAGAIRRRGKLSDAVRVYKLNVEVSPTSGFALRQAAGAELASGDTATAIASLEKALGINAKDAQAISALEAIRKRPDHSPKSAKPVGETRRARP